MDGTFLLFSFKLMEKKILVDPVFSGSVSPLKITNKAFGGTDIYTAEDIPELDYLVIIPTIIGII